MWPIKKSEILELLPKNRIVGYFGRGPGSSRQLVAKMPEHRGNQIVYNIHLFVPPGILSPNIFLASFFILSRSLFKCQPIKTLNLTILYKIISSLSMPDFITTWKVFVYLISSILSIHKSLSPSSSSPLFLLCPNQNLSFIRP